MLAQRSSGSYTAKSAMQKQDQRMRKGVSLSPPPPPHSSCTQRPPRFLQDLAPSADRLLTDRSSYIAYLESQLERVSAACLTVHSYDARLEEAVAAVRRLEEKILGVARLASTAQQYAEQQGAAQGAAQAELARRLRGVEARLDELERPGRAAEWEERLRSGVARCFLLSRRFRSGKCRAAARLKRRARSAAPVKHPGRHAPSPRRRRLGLAACSVGAA